MRAQVVWGALVVLALGVGAIAGLAAPRTPVVASVAPSVGQDTVAALAQVEQREEWLREVTAAAVAGRLDGTSVALLVADGVSVDQVAQVTGALKSAGATVGLHASVNEDWWTTELAAYRGEIADQVKGSVVGVEDVASTELLQHAIVQALVPDAVPAGTEPQGDGAAESATQGVEADRVDVLREVLTRSELLSVQAPATDAVDALVMVTATGPPGAGTMAGIAASVWEQYLPATVVVVFGDTDRPTVATEAITHGDTVPRAHRPSVVIATEPVLFSAQMVFALVEQRDGAAGAYGTAENLPLMPGG